MWNGKCRVWSVECGVWSVKCRVWSVEWKVWSVECTDVECGEVKVQSVKCGASPIDTATPQENQRLETRHLGAPKRAFRTRLPPALTLSTRYQTGWNVTKCHACHAKRHDNLLGNLRKRGVFQLPPIDTATPQANQRLETRHVDAEKPAFHTRLPTILTFLTHYQTGWNVTKCHACHAKRHDNFLGNLRKGKVLQLPP